VLDLIEAGKPVAEIAVQLGVSDQTIYNWRNQDRIDRGCVRASRPQSRRSWPLPGSGSESWRPSLPSDGNE
jgi:transposase-like protein